MFVLLDCIEDSCYRILKYEAAKPTSPPEVVYEIAYRERDAFYKAEKTAKEMATHYYRTRILEPK
jgi:hypothetical protein